MRRRAKLAKVKAKATRPLARKAPTKGAARVEELEKRLEKMRALLHEKHRALTEARAQATETLEQQTATSDILRLIGTSPTDAQPVFDGIARSAVTVLGARACAVFRIDGGMVDVAAVHNVRPERIARFRTQFPIPLASWPEFEQTIRDGIFHLADIEHNPDAAPQDIEYARLGGYRTRLMAPMMRGPKALGIIGVTTDAAQPFSAEHVQLLKTFADQAVIAIENVRLFTELQEKNQALTTAHAQTTEALEQQTATADILRVISSSPTDVQPVFAAMAVSAARLCDAFDSVIYQRDGDVLRLVGHEGPIPIGPIGAFTIPLSRATHNGRIVLDRRTSQVADLQAEVEEYPEGSAIARRWGHRTVLGVPLLRAGEALGVITVRRTEVRPFTTRQRELLQIFADQAVIAIENVRLFHEIAQKSRELEVASQHKSEFLASMSHELRTPLNAIIGFSDVLLQGMFGETNDKQTEYLRDILASGQHLLSLINDILDLSKIEAGKMELELADFDLPTAIDNAMILMRERAGRRGIALERTLDERLSAIRADERKVKQVLLNLLSNAVKFTPEGGRIDVRAILGDGVAEISVTDTGVGIAPADHEAVFEEFKQVGHAEKKAEGTGLGLALCRKFVELHGGRIWVGSDLGAGSTFTFSLPLVR
jgi:signal transduction histidine kinase